MISASMIYLHKKRYPTFDAAGLVVWLNEKRNWHWFRTVSAANKLWRRHKSFARYAQKRW